ncbi:hypothetical protein MPSEU_000316900 [Mayamaea pseudoterrestris]|nr:hypothetical protein MPSEU_000316900 [Mayamaea pseudoterrestris]
MPVKSRKRRDGLAKSPDKGQIAAKTEQRSNGHNMLHPMTMEASAILFLAMLTAWLYNYMRPDLIHKQQQSFIDLVCGQPDTSCLGSMRAVESLTSGTSIETKQPVRKGTIVLQIPRRLQIWEEDARQDDYIKHIIASMEDSLDGATILALYIAHWQKRLRENSSFYESSFVEHPVLLHYLLHQLPTYEHFDSYHPILWDDNMLAELLRRSSLSYAYVKDMQRQLHDEYSKLVDHVDRNDYYAARLSVLTRAFGTSLSRKANGSYAMVPILDSFNHQSPPNVGFTTQANGDFVVTALVNFRGEIHDSYGKRSDQNLFARYGFVNGDGTDLTQAGINLWHPVQLQDSTQMTISASVQEQYRLAILRYLQYDDGYSECVTQTDAEQDSYMHNAWRLKQLKYQFLLQRAHSPKHWIVTMSPRNKERQHGIPALDPSQVQFNATAVFSTCRVLSLTHEDYEGDATSLLEHYMLDMDYVLPDTRNALEFRTLFCMSRMASTGMERFATTIELEKQLIRELEPGTAQWMAAHLRLGEMQTLQALKHVSFSKLRSSFGENLLGSSPAYSMRNEPCPKDYLKPLLDTKG